MVCLRSANCRSFAARSWIGANLLLIEPARLVLPIARDEGDGVATVEQVDDCLHAGQRQ